MNEKIDGENRHIETASKSSGSCVHRFSRSMNQTYPRSCVLCGMLEPTSFVDSHSQLRVRLAAAELVVQMVEAFYASHDELIANGNLDEAVRMYRRINPKSQMNEPESYE